MTKANDGGIIRSIKLESIRARLKELREVQQFFNANKWALKFVILDLLSDNPGIRMKEVAVILMKSPSAVSQEVEKLKDKGFVWLKKPKDERVREIFITGKGLRHMENLEKRDLV